MASIITSISLDFDTMGIKDRLFTKNDFSRFVRTCLYEADAMANPTHTTEEAARIGGQCNGMARPPCVMCWPLGAPSHNDWIAYRNEAKFVAFPEVPSAQKQRIVKAALTDDDADTKSEKAPTRRSPQKGLIRRFIRWIY